MKPDEHANDYGWQKIEFDPPVVIPDLTEDEAAVILKMREWKDGIPEDALSKFPENAVYVSLVSARAELFRMAIIHGHNDVFERHERMHRLISPGLLIALCKAWQDLQDREFDEAHPELMENA